MFGAMRARQSEEDAARARRYRKWFNSLPPEEQERITREEEIRWKKDKPKVIALMIVGFLTLIIGLPMIAHMRRKAEWDSGKLISNDGKTTCKEVEYCSPCAPIHHWHKKIFCEPNE